MAEKIRIKNLVLALGATLVVGGCVTTGEQLSESVVDDTRSAMRGPAVPAQANMTGMAESLRCMDRLFLENSIRDLVVLTEDLNDNTRKVSVGSRDMLISAVSDMTRRSRAVRLITFGEDVSNLVNWLNASGANASVYNFVPDFGVRGSISQMDDNTKERRAGGGFTLGPVDADRSGSASASVVGIDMSVISAMSMELLPGVTTRNSIIVQRTGTGTGAGLTGRISGQRFGINYDFSFNSSEGVAQAVRTLVELGAIELFGKLARIPYWNCIGADPAHPNIRAEIEDWYFNLEQEQNLIPYIQNQLRIRGVYNGPADGSLNPEFLAVLPRARKALGLDESARVDEALFASMLNLKSKGLGAPLQPVAHLTQAQIDQERESRIKRRSITPSDDIVPIANPLPKPARLALTAAALRPGNDIAFKVGSRQPTYAYCFLHIDGATPARVFPNRYQRDPYINGGKSASFPPPGKNILKAGKREQKDTVTCFNTAYEVLGLLAPTTRAADLSPMQGRSIEDIRADFVRVSDGNFAETTHVFRKR